MIAPERLRRAPAEARRGPRLRRTLPPLSSGAADDARRPGIDSLLQRSRGVDRTSSARRPGVIVPIDFHRRTWDRQRHACQRRLGGQAHDRSPGRRTPAVRSEVVEVRRDDRTASAPRPPNRSAYRPAPWTCAQERRSPIPALSKIPMGGASDRALERRGRSAPIQFDPCFPRGDEQQQQAPNRPAAGLGADAVAWAAHGSSGAAADRSTMNIRHRLDRFDAVGKATAVDCGGSAT